MNQSEIFDKVNELVDQLRCTRGEISSALLKYVASLAVATDLPREAFDLPLEETKTQFKMYEYTRDRRRMEDTSKLNRFKDRAGAALGAAQLAKERDKMPHLLPVKTYP